MKKLAWTDLGEIMNLDLINTIRHLPRTGWLLRGIPPSIAESVADHSFMTSLTALHISLKLSEKGIPVNTEKILITSLLHDLPELITGDIPRYVKKENPELFNKLEEEALDKLGLSKFKELFNELESESSIEAVIVKIADNLATYIEGVKMLRLGYQVEEIVENTKKTIMSLIEKIQSNVREKMREILSEYIGFI